MNKVILKGRLIADPELRQTPNNISVTKFTVAVDRYAKAGEEKKADFISCVAWRQTAEFVSKYFSKGKEILLIGSLQTGSYEKDGVKHYTTDVLVDNVEFCGSKSSSSGESENKSDSVNIGDLGDFEEILSDGDVPF